MREVGGFLSQANDNTLDMHIHQQVDTILFVLVLVVGVGDDAHVAHFAGLGLDTLHDMGIMVERYIGHHNTNGTGGIVT